MLKSKSVSMGSELIWKYYSYDFWKYEKSVRSNFKGMQQHTPRIENELNLIIA